MTEPVRLSRFIDWEEAEVDSLILSLFAKGYSLAEMAYGISRAIARPVSRDALIGRLHRLPGWAAIKRPSPIKPPGPYSRKKRRSKKAKA